MILLVVVLVSFTHGEVRNALFKKTEIGKFIKDLHLSLSCGGRCLAESNCRAFVIVKVMQQCEISMDSCKEEDDVVCYRRITDVLTGYSESGKGKNSEYNLSHQTISEERLLIVPAYANLIPKVYDFQSKIITDRPDLKFGRIRCITSMPESKDLLFGTLLPDRIQRYSKGAITKTIAKFKASSLAADGDEDFVFMVKYRSKELYRTNLDIRKTVLRIFSSPERLCHVVSNIKAKQLYLASDNGLLVTSYNGRILSTGVIGDAAQSLGFVLSLVFDRDDNILYYCHSDQLGSALGRFIINEMKFEKLIELFGGCSNMVHHKGRLFISRGKVNQLCEVIINSTKDSCTSLGKIYDEDHLLLTAVTSI